MVPKRAFWAATGYAAGFGTSIWAVRKAKAAARRFAPAEVVARSAASAGSTRRRIGGAISDAFSEGREVMRSREAQMRADLENRGAKSPIWGSGEPDEEPSDIPVRANLRLVDEAGSVLGQEIGAGAPEGKPISKRASMRARRLIR